MSERGGPRFSLPVGEGVGALLCLAGGDSVGEGDGGVYTASTQQSVVVAYHLIRHGSVDRDLLAGELAALDGDDREPSVFRRESRDLRVWLDSVREGEVRYATDPSLDPSVRVAPVGMWYRRRPDELVEAVLETARVTHLDGPSAVVAAANAAAVAASCFAQGGHDLLMAVTDIAARAASTIKEESFRFSRTEDLVDVVDRFRRATQLVGASPNRLIDELGTDPVGTVATTITLAGNVEQSPETLVEEAANRGGSPLGAIAGAIVGARVGVRMWPWPIPNDTWFVALGRRLVAGSVDLEDLPVPYAVEQRLTYSNESDQR